MDTLSVVVAHSDSPAPETGPLTNTVTALEQIRRMRGGSQAHLMRCSDQGYYVVKFQNNPQHRRILANEFLATRLAEQLGLPTTPVAIVNVSEELIRWTEDLAIELPRRRVPCAAGLQFGSRYPGDPRHFAAFDFLSDEDVRRVTNLSDFLGMLVFDKWTCNTDGRQTIFLQERPPRRRTVCDSLPRPYRAVMIDQGFCFNAGEWNFPDAPLRGLYTRNLVYESVTGMESFARWIERLEANVTEETFAEIIAQLPPEWYEDDYDALITLCEQLLARRRRIPTLIKEARGSNRQPFPNWFQDAIYPGR